MGGTIDGERLPLGGYRSYIVEFRNFNVAHSNGLLMALNGGG